MRLQLDIRKQLPSRGRVFELRSRFSTADRHVVLFGPSGSGKSLTLNALAGLLTPDSGTIAVDGVTFFDASRGVDLPARERHVGYVFQDYALFPHLSVRHNVAFGLKKLGRRLGKAHAGQVEEMLSLLGLAGIAGNMPAEISGGQRQRTALARALVTKPGLLLLDEPFSALDEPLRKAMRQEVLRILEYFDMPLVLVTHDPADVSMFGSTVVMAKDGRVEETVTLAELEARGASLQEALAAWF
ncbi:ABC transporter ATP-binding protein [Oceanidesulfovibrio marinus]|uniref:ATP-binding cassette domain-containing protein n=1 Tax=Oceanidesulfovibrio marinus TaxID=370038 RepID=A0ABX6NN28_9BACT|nr:ATP-binding cassette domain-containing protein [Oceanidesulfovibrio marinus]QJT11030.1 ATP-binding cassette domain-containing protein [Oceanidesulfovibrio marinus]